MNIEQIITVDTLTVLGDTLYVVTLDNGMVCQVPNDPANNDWVIVQEWLALNP